MLATGIIAKKRDGGELCADEIAWIVDGLLRGAVTDAQMAALLMAVVLRGMSDREVADLTLAMQRSGETLDLSSLPGVTVDKHSTGGVGDKTTLVVAPLAAALGVPVAKMAGRALGHTGGTIDKLECLGVRTDLSPEQFVRQIRDIGLAVTAQTDRVAPADKRIYALRDHTATVESVPLIASSVMSKKLAVGAKALVLDVKAGEGALVPGLAPARELARAMVTIGKHAGQRVVALVTAMDQPLGSAVGDAAEVVEAVQTLQGQGPADLAELCELLAGYMLWVGEKAANPEQGRAQARAALASGAGLEKLRELVQAQGGDPELVNDPTRLLAGAETHDVVLGRVGYVTRLDARGIGLAIRDLKAAAGATKAQCGARLHAKVGARVEETAVAVVLAPRGLREALGRAAAAVTQCYEVGDEPASPRPLLQEVVT